MTRQEIEALLPFLANDTLQGDERAAVEAAVAVDPALAAELDALKTIRTVMQTEAEEDTGYSPGEVGLARLMRGVEAETQVMAPVEAPVVRPVIWQFAAAVLLALVVGQSVYFGNRLDDSGVGYQLAGTASFEITLVETATEGAIRAMLLEAGVEITAGPSALGLYELHLLEGVTLEEAREVLEASPLIESLSLPEE